MTSFLTRLACRFSAIYQRPIRDEENTRVSAKLQHLAEALVEVKRAIEPADTAQNLLHTPKKDAQRDMMQLKMRLHRALPASPTDTGPATGRRLPHHAELVRPAALLSRLDAQNASHAIERSIGCSSNFDFQQLLHGGRHYHVVGSTGLPSFLNEQLRTLSEGRRVTYIAGTQSHAFTLVLQHTPTRPHEPAHYLIQIYSPGNTLAHTKLRIHRPSETERLSSARFCADPSRAGPTSLRYLTLFIEVPSSTHMGGPTSTRVRTYASPDEKRSPAYIQTLSCVDGAEEIQHFFRDSGKHLPPGQISQLLSADVDGTRSALFQAATHGSSAVVAALLQATLEAWARKAISTDEAKHLFTGDTAHAGPAHVLFQMLAKGHADTIQVYLAALIDAHKQGLIAKPQLVRLLIAPGPDGLTGLSMCLQKNQTAAKEIYVDALYAAVKENIISENDLHTIFTQGQHRPHPAA